MADCRAVAGNCDFAERCDGSSATCPVDEKSTAVCRPSVGLCDLTETCDGTSAACPADAKSSALCRSSVGACDLAESCDGTSVTCPADAKSSSVCRALAGVCDLAETCDGTSNSCPADAKSSASCRAAAGICDLAETCDGVASACPADVKRTSPCRATAYDCDAAELCDGAANACPSDAVEPFGTPCSADGAACTADRCDGAGTCEHVADGSVCDDFNPCTTDSCDAMTGCTNEGVPMACSPAARAKLVIADRPGFDGDKLKWKWARGDGFEQADLGQPDVDTTYALCVYDYDASTPELRASIVVQPTADSWRSYDPDGWKYNDGDGLASGARKIGLRTGVAGKAKISMTAAGVNLPLPGPVDAETYFAQDPYVLVQLVHDGGGACWESPFSAGATNTTAAFRATLRVP